MTAPALSPQDLQAIASAAPQWRGGNVAVVQTPHAGRVVVKSMRAPRHPARYRLLGALAGMIDFEDDPLQVMPLADAQARNWLDYLHSTLWLAPLPQAEADACLDAWMQAAPAATRARFTHACQRLAWLRALPTHRRWGRDTVSLQAAAAAAHRFLGRHSAPSA